MKIIRVPYTIRIATHSVERQRAIEYIENSMARAFKCAPPRTHGLVFVAEQEDTICGALVHESAEDAGRFSFESRYVFDPLSAPFPFVRSQVVFATRWISSAEGVSFGIIRESGRVAHAFGKRYFLIEAKEYTVRRLHELSIDCRVVPGAQVLLPETEAVVGAEGMAYYRTVPPPTLYMMSIEQILALP